MSARKGGVAGRDRKSRLDPFINAETIEIDDPLQPLASDAHASLLVRSKLQDVADYRGVLQAWFEAIRTGGMLLLTVPHAFLEERQLSLPVRALPERRRLYSPAALLAEIEEALAPNSYRIRLLADDDEDYDYLALNDAPRKGTREIAVAIEKLMTPSWSLDRARPAPAAPDYAFEPERTRIEALKSRAVDRIIVLKLDHLGDFVMGVPALEHLRATFPGSDITLAVGSWNVEMARLLGVADRITAFDAFPRNSAEEEVDVPGKRALFDAAFPEFYDLAIDLRSDGDTRTLLGRLNAPLKAGLGSRIDHPMLDIALPLDLGRVEREQARETRFDHHAFSTQESVERLPHRAAFRPDRLRRDGAIVWGPYHRLAPGHYLFDPFLEIEPTADGLLQLDVAIDIRRATRRVVSARDDLRLEFDVERPHSQFEFRIFPVEETPAPPFSFFGGRLVRQGMPGMLHQSDYLMLLVDLIARRVSRLGLLSEALQP